MGIINKIKYILIMLAALTLTACGTDISERDKGDSYMNITAQEAKEIMDTESDYVILDVRTQEEYDEGHIKDAMLIPDYEIADRAESELTDKEQLILVYCRSGRRSKNAAKQLSDMGYSNVKEFGGIIDWPYDIVN